MTIILIICNLLTTLGLIGILSQRLRHLEDARNYWFNAYQRLLKGYQIASNDIDAFIMSKQRENIKN